MPVHEFDPLQDARWPQFVESHPASSAFHSVAWLSALQRTYRYTPVCFTTTPPGIPLVNALVFCRVNSWLTGSRLVSLPFSDHCEPLVSGAQEFAELLSHVAGHSASRLKYTEIRPRTLAVNDADYRVSERFKFHALDLTPGLPALYAQLHKDSIQRKIQRADREGVIVEEGRSEALLRQFYELLVVTRRRHGSPPQPFRWFRNLVETFGSGVTVFVARHGDRRIASILTLLHKETVVYKYGGSDERYHNLGGMPRLFWHAIERAKTNCLKELDLGRSEETNAGLIQFKNRLGAQAATLSYWRRSRKAPEFEVSHSAHPLRTKALACLPDRLFRLSGELFYRHAG